MLLKVSERFESTRTAPDSLVMESLTLPFEIRQKSRFRARTDGGSEVGIILERGGGALRNGDCLRAENGALIRIVAADEALSHAGTHDSVLLCKAGYHLGNRHVLLQVGPGWLRYQHDHVLDDMVRGLGIEVEHIMAPFEPEPGAYGGDGHGHHHGYRP
uniref:Urease accessory protein UreE n=1 Tax=Candidatus Kentrum sp. FW TaxID=2126338 RepID=A0A450SM32_9GAMM|nr:MAG: urease accessory protein [Candidatus Kentron sp. FW]VFJ61059.1 MAG: urease accessory protein [Candidatus Kentron sp. FW]